MLTVFRGDRASTSSPPMSQPIVRGEAKIIAAGDEDILDKLLISKR